ncbi:hypothetical protein JRI60_30020 [Archangium violaceum]|uniref:hypothetical protein n=1 Tax=Archangium violaceum TaxID=83451 RepID=UPI00194F2854|nr:hypothetical protein [Archangium violaceum]QRN93419.1 hypothetical protein JRI60_30020 [Archangium violaceum]
MCSRPVSLLLLLVGLGAGLWPVRAAGADAVRRSSGGAIRILCTPGHLLLGTDLEAEVRIEVDPAATGLELIASTGEVGAVKRVGPGVFRATYVPPRQSLPEVVVLAATARGPGGELEGWSLFPLWGQGQAEVRTRAGAPVTLQVGDRTFGPVLADASGLARIPVAVPPGVGEAFFGRRRIDLGLPPQPYLHAVANRREVLADREETVVIRLHDVRPAGGPARPGAFSFSVSRGTVSAPVEQEPGVSIVRWTVPPGRMGELELKGSVPREPRWSVDVHVSAVPGPAQRFEMRVDREEIVASEEVRMAVEVSARDAAGNPARVGLRLEPEVGDGVVLTERQPGEYAGALGVAPGFGARERLELRLFAEGGSTPVLSRSVSLRAAAPARVTVEPRRTFLVADGESEATWHISVVDRFGNPVREPRPETSLSRGQEGTLVSRGPGTYELRYVPPTVHVDGLAELEVRVGGVLGRGTLPLLRRRPMLLVAPHAGVVTNFADVLAPSAGLRLEVWPVRQWPVLGLMLDTGYLRFSRTGGERVPGFLGLNELLDVTAAVGLRTLGMDGLQGWVAGGPALVRVRSRASTGGGPVLEEDTWVLGAQAMVGAGIPLGPGQPFLEARFCWFDDPSLRVLRGALRGGSLHLGYRLALF